MDIARSFPAASVVWRSRTAAWIRWWAVAVFGTLVLRANRERIGQEHAVLTFLLVALGGSVGGGWPLGLALTVGGMLALDYFFQAPYGVLSLGRDTPLDWLVLLAFVVTAALATHQLALYRSRAAERARLSELVLASVSHDLRTPLTTIKALAQQGALLGDPNAVAIEEQADRLSRLVGDLLDYSRLNEGVLPVKLELNTAEDLVGAALRQIAGLAGERLVHAHVDLSEPALVGRFDFVQSLRILTNLIENALHYSPPTSEVELSVRRIEAMLAFEVADRGPGIAAAERERIFEPFYRPRTAARDGARAGLGLAIARRLAELQGGSLEQQPRPGGGSVFVLRLQSV